MTAAGDTSEIADYALVKSPVMRLASCAQINHDGESVRDFPGSCHPFCEDMDQAAVAPAREHCGHD